MKKKHKNPHNHSSRPKRLSYKIREAASMLGVSPSTLRKMVRRGELNVITSFGPWLIAKDELARLMKETLR